MCTRRKRIAKSPEEPLLILLTMACLNSGPKRDEANSLYEDNKPTGQLGQTHTQAHRHTYTHAEYIHINTLGHIYCFLLEFRSTSKTIIIPYISRFPMRCGIESLLQSPTVKKCGSGDFDGIWQSDIDNAAYFSWKRAGNLILFHFLQLLLLYIARHQRIYAHLSILLFCHAGARERRYCISYCETILHLLSTH